MSKSIKFGTEGWRAVIAEDFTFDNVELVTKGIIKYITEEKKDTKPIIIGYDTRFLADKFAQKAANTFIKYGIKVKLTKEASPTPAVALNAKLLNTAGAIMFTASHNSHEYCGLKYIPDYAGPATTDITDKIVYHIDNLQTNKEINLKSTKNQSYIELLDPKPLYLDWIRKLVDTEVIKSKDFKVYYDPMYSTGIGYMDTLLEECNVKVHSINNYRDPLFGGKLPEPREKFLSDLISMVKTDSNAIGLANDGDGDRFGIINEEGKYLHPNIVISLLLYHLIKNKKLKGSIVRSIATTHLLDDIAQKYHLPLYETPVGFKYIGEIMRKETVLIGGEESGGMSIINNIPQKDGILANLSILEAMAYSNKTLVELEKEMIKDIGREYFYKRVDLKVDNDIKERFIKNISIKPPEIIAGERVSRVSTLDGTKLYLNDGSWLLARPSGTEPLLRIYFETSSSDKLENMIANIKEMLDKTK
ncbi:MAG: phosphoglucomutase/phosphomannomutase family protein [Vampirovibrionia bacterium]